jgi:hypothetical protein
VFSHALVQSEGAASGETAWDYLGKLRSRVPGLISSDGGVVVKPGLGRVAPLLRRTAAMRSVTDARKSARQAAGPAGGVDSTIEPGGGVLIGDGLTAAFHSAEPLLYQLLDTVVDGVPFRDSMAFTQALDTLRARPVDELELRLRETLGLASHRLDAWITGLARERLDNLRADDAHPNCIQLGGFGWVEDLRPDDRGTGDSQGFIHAPSLAHATTAAVLRAGWNAHGTSAADSTMAVDLRSDRIRLGSWLLDGVRQGQALGDLLGRRFERRLHDAHLDGFIDDCRRAVLESQGKKRAPTGPVDGLLLAELYAGAGVKAGATLLKPASVPSTVALRGVQAALNDIRASMDAVADAALGDSVHHLLQGNQARAAATLDAISTGEVPPPELRSVRTPRPGVGIVHRLLLTFDAAAKGASAWGSGPRARLEPALESWCARMLGDPARVRCRVEFPGGSAAPLAVTLADLIKSGGLSALDLVFEAPVGALAGDTAWIRRIEAHVLAEAQYAPYEGALVIAAADAPMDGTISLHDMAELAQALRSLIAKSRPLDGRDLRFPVRTPRPDGMCPTRKSGSTSWSRVSPGRFRRWERCCRHRPNWSLTRSAKRRSSACGR